MKKIIISMLAMAALVSCTESTNDTSANPDLTPINLTGGVMQVEVGTKAPVTGGNIEIAVAGWATNTGFTATAWETSAANFAVSETASNVGLSAQQYYNVDGSDTYIRAWYPKTTPALSNGVTSFTNTTGDVDVMVSNLVNGSKTTPAGELTFAHMTTQLIFEVVKEATLTDVINIQSIAVNAMQLPTGFDFKQAGEAAMVTYATAADLPVPTITEKEITTAATVAGAPVMVKTPTGATINLTVITDQGTHNNVTATVPIAFEAGTAYTITITFKGKQVVASAKVTAWKTSTGSAEII